MSNADFFRDIYAGYWESIDRSRLTEDDQDFFGDPDVFAWLIRRVRPQLIVEVGSWKGCSANVMADMCKAQGLDARVVGVDTFLGSVEHWIMPELRQELHIRDGRPTLLERFLGNTIARGNEGVVFPFPADSFSASRVFKAYGVQADLIYVDGAHAYDAVTRDIDAYWPLLAPGGLMFGDDYRHPPVAQAVHDCAAGRDVAVAVYGGKWAYLPADASRADLPPGCEIVADGRSP